MNRTEREQIREMAEFLKKAFCIDGDCDYIEDVTVESSLKTTHSSMFALGDSKRGMFYVTISK
jgi:hypothetical protein